MGKRTPPPAVDGASRCAACRIGHGERCARGECLGTFGAAGATARGSPLGSGAERRKAPTRSTPPVCN
jgi:hypothetical protein